VVGRQLELPVIRLRSRGPGQLTYDLDVIDALTVEERQRAQEILIARLRDGDFRAAETLGAGGFVGAVPALREARSGARGMMASSVDRALARLEATSGGASRLADGLEAQHPVQAALSAHLLGRLGDAGAVPGLVAALTNPWQPTRINAKNALFALLGLEDLADPLQSPLWSECLLLLSELPSVVRHGAERLGRIAEALVGGATPEALDLVYRPGPSEPVVRFGAALEDTALLLDIADVRAMGEHDRTWALHQLLSRVDGLDPRVPAALASLGPPWVADAFDEALERLDARAGATPSPAVAAMARAIRDARISVVSG
jgi:hypothetical protein